MKTILIFEPLSGGHRANFIGWLRNACSDYSDCRFVFFTTDDVDEQTAGQLASAGRWKKQKLLYQLFRQACRNVMPDQALVLELTPLELPLALFGSPVPLSAILFVQYPERFKRWKGFSVDGSGSSKHWKNLWVQAQPASKHWKTRLLLWRAPVKNLFLLNGEKSCRFLSEQFGPRTRFIPVPDPVPEITAEADRSIRRDYRISDGQTVFLFFGAVSPRKGADVLLDALLLLPPEAAAKSTFLFCGEPEPGYRKTFTQAVARLREARPDITLNMEDRFVSDPFMMALFEQSDVVLMPYTRPEYSSGILALAAKARTPVIGPDSGLLGRLIRQNGLGAVCPTRPEALAKSMADATNHLPAVDESLRSAFVQKSRPDLFARTILDAIRKEG